MDGRTEINQIMKISLNPAEGEKIFPDTEVSRNGQLKGLKGARKSQSFHDRQTFAFPQ